MNNRKGQITLFIIIGLVVLVIGGIVFYLVFSESGEKLTNSLRITRDLPLKPTAVKTFVEACLRDVSVPGIYLLANNGGYIYEYEKVLFAENRQSAFHFDHGNDTSPTVEFMETELSRFVKDSMVVCLEYFQAFEGYDIETGEMSVTSSIDDESVSVKMRFPITITEETAVIELSKFSETFPVRIGKALEVRDEIVEMVRAGEGIDLDRLSEQEMRVTVLPFESGTTVYSIYDNRSNVDDRPFVFNFAVKAESNNAPELGFLPDFVVGQGKSFTYDVNATDIDEDTLTFFSDQGQIDGLTGMLSVVVQETTTVRVCASDGKAEDCGMMKLMVNE